MAINPLTISAYTLTNALGTGIGASLEGLRRGRSGLRPCDLQGVDLQTWIGRVDGLETIALPESLQAYDCRNNRLAYLALLQDDLLPALNDAVARYGAARIGVFIGTSTSGIANTEQAYQKRYAETGDLERSFDAAKTHNIFSAVSFVRALSGVQGPALAISTACSSSAKVFAAAHRYIETGLCDAALVGGVDSLCLTTLYGFNALDLISPQPCRPWDLERQGINIGEAAGFALLERPREAPQGPQLLGYGESSDAYHMSTPHPQGDGAMLAMRQALARAGLAPSQIDYINLHGTATRSNDAAEDQAVVRLFGEEVACSSSKGFTGHTLGAAGINEAIFSLLAMHESLMPQNLLCETPDPALRANVLQTPRTQQIRRVASNSFGFGGNNCSLVFGCGE